MIKDCGRNLLTEQFATHHGSFAPLGLWIPSLLCPGACSLRSLRPRLHSGRPCGAAGRSCGATLLGSTLLLLGSNIRIQPLQGRPLLEEPGAKWGSCLFAFG